MKFKVLQKGERCPNDGGNYLAEYQQEFIESEEELVVGVMGRGTGKSKMLAVTAARLLKSGANGLLLAPTFEDCDVTLNFLLEVLDDTHTKYTHNKSKNFIQLKRNKARLYYRPTESDKGIRGKTNISFLMVDEAALCKRERYLEAVGCLRGKIKFRRRYLISTPKGRGNWLYEEAMSESAHLIIRKTTDSPFLDEGFYETLRGMYGGDFFEQEVNAGWIDLNASLIYSEEDYLSLNTYRQPQPGAVVVGVDVATGGDNSSCTLIRGTEVIRVISRKTSPDVSTILDLIRDTLGGLAPDYIAIDSTGVGAYAPAEVSKRWPACRIIPVNFGAAAFKQGYENRRAEIHFDLRSKISQGLCFGPQVSPDIRSKIQKQMRATEYMIGRKGAYRIIEKKEIKAKLGESPDELDSLALACSVDQAALARINNNQAPVIGAFFPNLR